MTEKEGLKVTNISENGNTGLFWLGKDNLSVYDVVRLINDLLEENEQLLEENEQLKEELESFEQVSFTDLCDGSRTVLYMKKENVGDSE